MGVLRGALEALDLPFEPHQLPTVPIRVCAEGHGVGLGRRDPDGVRGDARQVQRGLEKVGERLTFPNQALLAGGILRFGQDPGVQGRNPDAGGIGPGDILAVAGVPGRDHQQPDEAANEEKQDAQLEGHPEGPLHAEWVPTGRALALVPVHCGSG